MIGIAAGATLLIALVIFILVPEPVVRLQAALPGSYIGLRTVYRDERFWRLAPLSTMCIGTAWAIQGLWAAPWLADVDGLGQAEIVRHLLIMAITLSAAALLLGIGADRMRSHGIQPQAILSCAAILFMAAELMLILDPRSISYATWAVVAGMGAATVLSYSILTDVSPRESAGRANAALNVFHIGGAFLLQEIIGWLIDRWPAHAGHYPPIAYKTALALIVGLPVRCSRFGSGNSIRKLRAASPGISTP